MKFVVDISSGVITEEQAIQQATAVFYRDRTKETQKIMIINNGKIVKVLEK